jgi:hypothetical protein
VQSEGAFSNFSGDMRFAPKDGEAGVGVCSPSHSVPVVDDGGLNPNESNLDVQMYGVDRSNFRCPRVPTGRSDSGDEPIVNSQVAAFGEVPEKTDAALATCLIGNVGGFSEQRDACSKMVRVLMC